MKFPIEVMGVKCELVLSKTEDNITLTIMPFGQSKTFSKKDVIDALQQGLAWAQKSEN